MPSTPPRRGGPAPRLPGGYDLTVESFRVEEIPSYAPSGAGEHTLVCIEKRGMSTLHCGNRLASLLDIAPREVGYAGLKDRHATTVQWFSVPLSDPAAIRAALDPAFDPEAYETFRVLDAQQHQNKLKLGHLRGNRFTIDLRPDLPAGATRDPAEADALRTNLEDLAARGVPNFVGAQRFGSGGRNLDKGLRALRGNPRRAIRKYRKPLLRLLLSSVQSEVFNRVLAARLDTTDRLLAGDIAWRHNNGACFAVEDPDAEQSRCADLEISPTGPLPGPACLRPADDSPQAKIERDALAALELESDAFAKYKTNPGERRPLRTRLRDPLVEVTPGGGLRVAFELDRGSYATTVLRELVEDPPWIVDTDPA